MNQIVKPALMLALLAFFSALVLSHARKITDPYILSQEIAQQKQAIELVLHGYTLGEELIARLDDNTEFSYWMGTKVEDDIEKKGYAFISVGYGYSGEIKSMVGIDEENKILGISVMQQTETPGLGDRINEPENSETIRNLLFGGRASDNKETGAWFQKQFSGIDLNKKIFILKKGLWTKEISSELIEKNAITAITGATVTTKAIVNGIKDDLIKFKKAKLIIEQERLMQEQNQENLK